MIDIFIAVTKYVHSLQTLDTKSLLYQAFIENIRLKEMNIISWTKCTYDF
jgi:hypothetical protein